MIIPAILVKNFKEFENQFHKVSFAKLIQIDVMDGHFVPNHSFQDIEKINDLKSKNEWELHLMVDHPLAEIEKWKNVKNILRIIFHFECQDNITDTIEKIKSCGFEAGLALNPDTDPKKIHRYLKDIEEVMFMTVFPGMQGAPFVPTVEKHIKKFNKMLSERNYRPQIAVDGGIKLENIAQIKKWGVQNFCVGSTLLKADHPKEIFKQLNELI